MFTGIIQAIGRITAIEHFADDRRLTIATEKNLLSDVKLGDSIAVNGVCLTVVDYKADTFSVDVSPHTLDKTTLRHAKEGSLLNLEKCLQLNSYLGGHCVLGHVDGIAELIKKENTGRGEEWIWKIPQDLLPLIAVKGSITIEGISLTVNTVDKDKMGIALIPHTLTATTLENFVVGDKANIEVDVIARYVARHLDFYNTREAI